MASDAVNRLTTALAQIDQRILDLTLSLNPDHSEAGRSVSTGALLQTLTDARDKIYQQLTIETQRQDGPFEIKSYGV